MYNKRIVITGGEGFVGKKLAPLLQAHGHNLTTIDKSNGNDITEKDSTKNIDEFDVLIHLAAVSFVPDSYKDPERFYRTNILTTLNALELCRKYQAKMVFISSYVYGMPKYLPIDEKHPVAAYNPYAQSKIICEMICEGYHRDFKVPVIVLRPFNIYGNGQNDKFLISTILTQLVSGNSVIKLKDPTPKRDYVHIEDVVYAIKAAVNSSVTYGVYNVCSNSSFSVREITEIIGRNLKKAAQFNFDKSGERVSEVRDTLGSFVKIYDELGWKPQFSFEEGIIKDLKELDLL